MVAPYEITWQIGKKSKGISAYRKAVGELEYEAQKKSLRDFLCAYFDSDHCDNKLGDSVSPLGASKAGAKVLKVRWLFPGSGKSGGLRLAVMVFCKQRRVVIAEAWVRKINPSDQDVWDAVSSENDLPF